MSISNFSHVLTRPFGIGLYVPDEELACPEEFVTTHCGDNITISRPDDCYMIHRDGKLKAALTTLEAAQGYVESIRPAKAPVLPPDAPFGVDCRLPFGPTIEEMEFESGFCLAIRDIDIDLFMSDGQPKHSWHFEEGFVMGHVQLDADRSGCSAEAYHAEIRRRGDLGRILGKKGGQK